MYGIMPQTDNAPDRFSVYVSLRWQERRGSYGRSCQSDQRAQHGYGSLDRTCVFVSESGEAAPGWW